MLTQHHQPLIPSLSYVPPRKLSPFQRSDRTWANVFIDLETEESLSPKMLNTLAAVTFQNDTRRQFRPFTYMEMGLRTKQKRNTIAWDLHYV